MSCFYFFLPVSFSYTLEYVFSLTVDSQTMETIFSRAFILAESCSQVFMTG